MLEKPVDPGLTWYGILPAVPPAKFVAVVELPALNPLGNTHVAVEPLAYKICPLVQIGI